jgi:hypothetical protein
MSQPATALIGAVLILQETAVQQLEVVGRKVGKLCAGGSEPALAVPAMTYLYDSRLAFKPVPHGATKAATLVDIGHGYS